MLLKTSFETIRHKICKALSQCIQNKFNVAITIENLANCVAKPKNRNGELNIHFHRFKKMLNTESDKSADILKNDLIKYMANNLTNCLNQFIQKIETDGPFITFHLKLSYFGNDIIKTVKKLYSVFDNAPKTGERIMIEYSQPNTHKAFHVGHMRNAALGDSLVRLYKHMGHTVIAVNYFGDEGAHVAKCLWLLKRLYPDSTTLFNSAAIPPPKRGEFLGAVYAKATALLDLTTYTCLPVPDAISARVLSISAHPRHAAWKVLSVDTGAGGTFPVVCNGHGFSVGDVVAYIPVGGRLRGKAVEKKEMNGVASFGVVLAVKEVLGPNERDDLAGVGVLGGLFGGKEGEIFVFPEIVAKMGEKDQNVGENDQNVGEKDQNVGEKLEIGPWRGELGKEIVEIGRVREKEVRLYGALRRRGFLALSEVERECEGVFERVNFEMFEGVRFDVERRGFVFEPSKDDQLLAAHETFFAEKIYTNHSTTSLADHIRTMKAEVSTILKGLEEGEESVTRLMEHTKAWSIAEFKRIYDWLGCRFDHDFYESKVSAEAKGLVKEYREKGVLKLDQGCIGADLSKEKLGFCILEKSDGRGLYATKDLRLAQVKFDDFKIDKSIYVVDVAQTFHFKQVFAVLNQMGYEKVKECQHLAYALVTLPGGKMSSRKGNVIVFSDLVDQLNRNLREKCFSDDKIAANPYWTAETIEHALRVISVGTIKYGMLNQDTAREIVFNLDEWINPNGNTASYLMYQYTRITSILREVEGNEKVANTITATSFDLMTHPLDRYLMFKCLFFMDVVKSCVDKNNPLLLCNYLYDLCKAFSSWYNLPEKRIKSITDTELKNTHLVQIMFLRECIKRGLNLLGIDVLDKM